MTPSVTPNNVLTLLKDGNCRFLDDAPLALHGDRTSRLRMAAAQRSIAAYLSCSDSRVAPEFIIWARTGRTVHRPQCRQQPMLDCIGQSGIRGYRAGVPLIVVMGHENCGALRAAVSVVKEHYGYSANINKVL